MRVIRYLLTALLGIALIGVIGFFASREVLLYLGTRRLDDSLDVLRVYAQRDAAREECQILSGGDLGETQEIIYQLRFINSQEYLLEAICPLNQSNPITLGTNSLPPFITKVQGKSGYIWTEAEDYGVQIEAFQEEAELANKYWEGVEPELITRSKNVTVEDGEIQTSSQVLPPEPGPVTSCEGYGYTCCDPITATGSGEQLVGLNDCPESCFSRCLSRPVILSFTTNPFFDVETRVIAIKAGTPLEFAYVADEKGGGDLRAIVEFGDGERSLMDGSQGKTTHQYQCQSSSCTYTAEITVKDESGVESLNTPVSRVTVEVSR